MRKLLALMCVLCCCISIYAQIDYCEMVKKLDNLSYSASWNRAKQIDGLKEKLRVIAVAKGKTKELADSLIADFFDVKMQQGIDSLKVIAYKETGVTTNDLESLIRMYSSPEAKTAITHLQRMCGGEAWSLIIYTDNKPREKDLSFNTDNKIYICINKGEIKVPKTINTEYQKNFQTLNECFGLNAVMSHKMAAVYESIHKFYKRYSINLNAARLSADNVFSKEIEKIKLIISHEYLTEDDIDALINISNTNEALKIKKASENYSKVINDYITSSVVSFSKSFSQSSGNTSDETIVKNDVDTTETIPTLPDIDTSVEIVYKDNQVEENPVFPGGENSLLNYIYKNVKYPKAAIEKNVYGRVVCTFIIAKDGTIRNVSVKESPDPLLEKEAIRVIRSMPKWIPGKVNGQNVNVWCRIPITFDF